MTRALRRAAAGLITLAACAACGSTSGDDIASDRAEQVADAIAANFANPFLGEPEEVAAYWFRTEAAGVDIRPLAWERSGSVGVRVDARIHVDVEERQSTSVWDQSWGAGQVTRCFRFTWEGPNETGTHRSIGCPDGPLPELPSPSPPPLQGDELAERVATVLDERPSDDEVEPALHEAFPIPGITIDVLSDAGGLAVAVGLPREQMCHVVYRAADGTVTHPRVDRIWLMPGELGCKATIATSPPG